MLHRFFLLACTLFTLNSSAQEIKENFDLAQVTRIGKDSLLVTGFKPDSKNTKFVFVLYDAQLKELARSAKTVESGVKWYFVEKIASTFRFTFYSATDKVKYRLNTDLAFKELYAGVPVENENSGLYVADEWTYAANYNNDYMVGNLLLDAQLTEITCYTLSDPIEGTYRQKWEYPLNEDYGQYQKVELLDIDGNTAYYSLVNILNGNIQRILALDLTTGKKIFSEIINMRLKTETLKTMAVSALYNDGTNLYLAGTYMLEEYAGQYPYVGFADGTHQNRGYDVMDYYLMYMADGYFVMSLNAATGAIKKVELFEFPSIDQSVDRRDYRLGVCPGIRPLKDGRIVAFFELFSCRTPIAQTELQVGGFSRMGDATMPSEVIWDLDAFSSVVFDTGLTDVDVRVTVWEEENVTYKLTDFDMFSLNLHAEHPREYVTIGDDGCYPHQFVCDGTDWTFVIRCDDDKSPDYLVKGNPSEQKVVKLLSSGVVYMLTPGAALERKGDDSHISLKIVNR